MAFDYGSIDLGLKNPFKTEGKVGAISGLLVALLGVVLLLMAAAQVKENAISGWTWFIVGLLLLVQGLATLGRGAFATFRYFVGRNMPTSLAPNRSATERSSAHDEAGYVAYSGQQIEEMIMGRKNTTFVEPRGFLARFLHSVFPQLLYMPYPIRNLAQELFACGVKTLAALVIYLLVAFVTLAGFVGEQGKLIFPVYSCVLAIYVLAMWWRAGRTLARRPQVQLQSMGSGVFARWVAFAIFLPVVASLALQLLVEQSAAGAELLHRILLISGLLPPLGWLLLALVMAAGSLVLTALLLQRRFAVANPKVEVSELRENWQESVHPSEVFINLDNLVMADRRYKEVPNRVYRELEPNLVEQVEGKGRFDGTMIQEVQPHYRPMELGETFAKLRLLTLVAGAVASVVAAVVAVIFAFRLGSFLVNYQSNFAGMADLLASGQQTAAYGSLAWLVGLVGVWVILRSFAALLSSVAHTFYAEMQFESSLIYFKCEGTFTESKMSTGAGIYDSTRSENTLVRSSITPWVIVTRLVTTTFAGIGSRNMEFPRYILEMHKADDELQAIRSDVMAFLKDRESIAHITSERDLGNASQIYQLNQQTRAAMPAADPERLETDAEAAGYLRDGQDS